MMYLHAGSHLLPHSLRVPILSNDALFESFGKYGIDRRVHPDVIDWLKHHVGTGDTTYASMGTALDWHACILNHTCIFCFRTKDAAVRFKLTWQT